MKNTKKPFIYLLLLLAFTFISHSVSAQEENHYLLLTTWEIQFPDDGDHEELYSLLNEWHEKVVLRNTRLLSEKTLVLSNTDVLNKWVAITEYKTRADLDSAKYIDDKLIAEGWPDIEEQKLFFDGFNKYSITRSDGIVLDIPSPIKNSLPFRRKCLGLK